MLDREMVQCGSFSMCLQLRRSNRGNVDILFYFRIKEEIFMKETF